MDDEDIADFGIAPKKLQATSNFFQKNDSKRAKPSHNSDDYFDKKNARLSQMTLYFSGLIIDLRAPFGYQKNVSFPTCLTTSWLLLNKL